MGRTGRVQSRLRPRLDIGGEKPYRWNEENGVCDAGLPPANPPSMISRRPRHAALPF